ncbi:MAG: nucleotide pyrophosphohydrolase [Archaeoglobi archaeon]|nr:nucleotide pyrophosphohydrolase [Candidatus Mnemosynella bozhongmuii]
MKISEFQRLMRELYFERDSKRGIHRTMLWLVEEVGELASAVRDGDEEKAREEIADIIAWTSSLANLLGIEIEEALREKYPGKCIKCGGYPCRCP